MSAEIWTSADDADAGASDPLALALDSVLERGRRRGQRRNAFHASTAPTTSGVEATIRSLCNGRSSA